MSPQATEIYQEGVQLPGIKLYKSGEIQQDIIDIISSNVRFSTLAIGDLNAEVAAVNIADNRIKEIVEKYGKETVFEAFEYLKNTSEKISIKAIKEFPNGIYEVEDVIDPEYTLEVSSPGLDRLLKKEKDFIRFCGKKISIQCHSPLNGKKRFIGCLTNFENQSIHLEMDGQIHLIPLNRVAKANLIIEI